MCGKGYIKYNRMINCINNHQGIYKYRYEQYFYPNKMLLKIILRMIVGVSKEGLVFVIFIQNGEQLGIFVFVHAEGFFFSFKKTTPGKCKLLSKANHLFYFVLRICAFLFG